MLGCGFFGGYGRSPFLLVGYVGIDRAGRPAVGRHDGVYRYGPATKLRYSS